MRIEVELTHASNSHQKVHTLFRVRVAYVDVFEFAIRIFRMNLFKIFFLLFMSHSGVYVCFSHNDIFRRTQTCSMPVPRAGVMLNIVSSLN